MRANSSALSTMPQRRVAVAIHDAVAQRAVVGADAQAAFQADAFQHERREFFLNALQLGGVLLVRVFLGRKFFRVGVVAGIDAHDFNPLHRFHRGFGLEMDVRHNRHETAAFMQFGDDVLQIRRVLHRRRGDADELAADGDEIERLLHAFGGVHRVAGEHGLLHDGMAAADDDPAARRIADDDFAGLSPVIKKRGFAVAHELFGLGRRGFRRLRRLLNLHVAFEHRADRAKTV